MTRPAASIVVPLLGTEDAWLERSVRSAVRQDRAEVVVVASRAATATSLRVLGSLARQFGNLQVVPLASGGTGAAINTGIDEAAADRIGFLMPEDWLEPDAIAQTLAVAADVVGTGAAYYGLDGTTRHDELTRIPDATAIATLAGPEAVASYLTPFLLFDRDRLAVVGGVDERIALGADDYDLVWRLLERGASVAVVERALYIVRDPERRQDAWFADLDMILAKHGASESTRARLLAGRDAPRTVVPA